MLGRWNQFSDGSTAHRVKICSKSRDERAKRAVCGKEKRFSGKDRTGRRSRLPARILPRLGSTYIPREYLSSHNDDDKDWRSTNPAVWNVTLSQYCRRELAN